MLCETASQRGFSELIRQCLQPAKPGRRQPLPIVLLWSPRLSGKSDLLDHIHRRFHRGRPTVRRRDAGLGDRRPHEVALQLADHLGRRVERFGRLRFPRLFLGMAAIRGPIGAPATTREEMIRRTVRDRHRLKKWARATSVTLLNTVAANGLTRVFTGLVLEGVLATLETAPLLRGRGLRWYRDGLGQHFADPVDALVELAEQEMNGHLRWVDEVLCRAFLADLRDGCSNRFFQLYDRNEHCLAMLDDANSPGVRAFFDILGRQRVHDWDPLLIIATSSKRFPVIADHGPEECPIRRADQASYTDWIDKRKLHDGWATLYPVTLDGVTLTEAKECYSPRVKDNAIRLRRAGIDVTGLLGGAERAVAFAHHLTEGHIGGLNLVLRAMTRERKRAAAENIAAEHVDLRRLFELPATDDGTPLADVILQHVLGTWPTAIRRVLIRSAAARNFGDVALERVLQCEPEEVRQTMRSSVHEFRARDTWVRHAHAMNHTAHPVLHPFVRRAVLHRLANPPDPDEPAWEDVHERLHRLAEERNDTTSSMYHKMAVGQVGDVAKALSELFSVRAAPEWFATLIAVTQAPLKNPAFQKNPERHCQWLADEAGDRHPVSARLVAALQLHTDPLGDPNHDLCGIVAHELETLADNAPEGSFAFLLKQANVFRRCHDSGGRQQPSIRRMSEEF